ncbi:MAG TPA: efflux RND transporter periplasmic adaptor subunit [Terriglobales bacterium]|nr:efflux RND transporter periplasmic adaptor subunit [Terriglobales bacterium]
MILGFPMKPSRTFKRAALAGALAIGLLLCGCSEKKQQAVAPRVPVTVADVVQKTVPIQVRVIGNVEAYSTVGVKPQITGEIVGVHFSEGQDVKKGQLLFTFDPRPFEADLLRAQANLAQDEAKAKNAEVEAHRYTKLVEAGVVAKEQAEQIQTNHEAMVATVKADRAQVVYARVQLVYTRIYSPMDGRTGSLMLHLGTVVKANPDNPMITINQVNPIYVTFSVPQQVLPEIKQHMAKGKLRVTAVIQGQEDRPEAGTLTFVDNNVDLNTGTIKLKGTFENSNRRLWPGQYVNVALTLAEQPNAIVVPTQAIQTGQQGSYVFIVKPDLTAESRPVKVERNIDNQAVIESGLSAGEKVVTDGQIRLVPGAKVEIKNGGMQAQETKP